MKTGVSRVGCTGDRRRATITVCSSKTTARHLFVVSAGLFDLKLAADALSDTVFYAFTSTTLKKLIPTESAIYLLRAIEARARLVGSNRQHWRRSAIRSSPTILRRSRTSLSPTVLLSGPSISYSGGYTSHHSIRRSCRRESLKPKKKPQRKRRKVAAAKAGAAE